MSNRGEFVGTAPTSGNYIPAPTPAEQEDLPVYINDELLRLGGVVNGVLEGGSLPPHSELPKRYKEGMIMNFSNAVGDGVDSSGVWLYKNAKWWKLIDDPTTITDDIYEAIDEVVSNINAELAELNSDLDNLNNVTLPALNAELDNLNNVTLPALEDDLSELDGRFPITTTDISDGAITTPKMVANTILGDRIVTNSLSGDKITANTINGNKIIANTVNGDRIIGNTIHGDKILANSIRGDKVVANSITADKLAVGSISGGKIDSSTTIRAGTGNQSASLDGADSNWRLYAGSAVPSSAPFRVDKDGNLFANSGTFGGEVYANKVSGEIASGSLIPYTGFIKSHDKQTKSFTENYTIARFSVEPVISGGSIMPSSINTGNMGSVDWVVTGAGYDRANKYSRKITVTLKNESTDESYSKVIHNEIFDGQSGFTDSISAMIPTLSLRTGNTTAIYSITIQIVWNLFHGTRETSKASLNSGSMVVTRLVDTNTIKSV